MTVPNQILPGHILLVLRQPGVRFAEISVNQLFDLTLAIKELTKALHERFTSQRISTTTIMQDCASEDLNAANQASVTMRQLHVHLIPRQSSHNMRNEEMEVCVQTFYTK